MHLASAWDPAPLVLCTAALALARFSQAFLRLRRRGRRDHAGPARAALFVGAVGLATLALVSPLDAMGDGYLISAHMLQHLLIGDVAPALALVALRGPMLFFFLPRPVLRAVARRPRLRWVLERICRPPVAFGLWIATIAAWHVPAAYDYTLSHPVVHDAEHLSFLVVGVLVWIQLVDPMRRGALSREQRVRFAGALFGCGIGLSAVLMVSARPLYPAYAHQQVRLFGWSALLDQQLAGAVMLAEQSLALGACALALSRRPASRRARRRSDPHAASA